MNYPSKIDDWKTFKENNPTIALCILKKTNYVRLISQKLIRTVKSK